MLRKPNFKKNNQLEKSPNAKNCKRGDNLGFFKIKLLAKFQKIEGGPFRDIEKVWGKNEKSEFSNSLIVPKT